MCPADKEVFSSFAHAQVSITNEIYQYLGEPETFLFCPTGTQVHHQNCTFRKNVTHLTLLFCLFCSHGIQNTVEHFAIQVFHSPRTSIQ